MIETLNDEIIVSVSQEQESDSSYLDNNPVYPVLREEEIKLFSIDKFLTKKPVEAKIDSIEIIEDEPEEVKVETKDNNLSFDVEALIKKIDERIKKIEEEQKKSSKQPSSVFDVFRNE